MTAATAHDLTVSALQSAERCARNARKIGNERMAARFERRALRLQSQLAEWREHPALCCTITPEGARFVIRSQGRRVRSASSLNAAQGLAVELGFRQIDVTRCGVFF